MFNGKTHYKWPFSIAMLNYQRILGENRGWSFREMWFNQECGSWQTNMKAVSRALDIVPRRTRNPRINTVTYRMGLWSNQLAMGAAKRRCFANFLVLRTTMVCWVCHHTPQTRKKSRRQKVVFGDTTGTLQIDVWKSFSLRNLIYAHLLCSYWIVAVPQSWHWESGTMNL